VNRAFPASREASVLRGLVLLLSSKVRWPAASSAFRNCEWMFFLYHERVQLPEFCSVAHSGMAFLTNPSLDVGIEVSGICYVPGELRTAHLPIQGV
jgi:hypothetical protein